MSDRYVVVGGGAVGLSIAFYLRRFGADVTVLEKGAVGGECSARNAGWVARSMATALPAPGVATVTLRSMFADDAAVKIAGKEIVRRPDWFLRFFRNCSRPRHVRASRALARLADDAIDRYDELAALGVAAEGCNEGILVAYLSKAEAYARYAQQTATNAHSAGGSGDLLSGEQLRAIEPALSPRVAAGFRTRGDRWLDPQIFCESLAALIRREGVRLRTPAHVVGFKLSSRRVQSVRTLDREYPADHVVLAAGAATARLARMLGRAPSLIVGRGYSMTVPGLEELGSAVSLGSLKVAATPLEGGVRLAGVVEIGTSRDHAAKRFASLAKAAVAYFSAYDGDVSSGRYAAIVQAAQHQWVGERVMTPDGLPRTGALPGVDNVSISTGHNMLGMTLAPSGGHALAAALVGARADDALAAFSPARR